MQETMLKAILRKVSKEKVRPTNERRYFSHGNTRLCRCNLCSFSCSCILAYIAAWHAL